MRACTRDDINTREDRGIDNNKSFEENLRIFELNKLFRNLLNIHFYMGDFKGIDEAAQAKHNEIHDLEAVDLLLLLLENNKLTVKQLLEIEEIKGVIERSELFVIKFLDENPDKRVNT